jgi:hypothetical protein
MDRHEFTSATENAPWTSSFWFENITDTEATRHSGSWLFDDWATCHSR